MLALLDLLDAIINRHKLYAPKRKIRRIRRTSCGVMIDYLR